MNRLALAAALALAAPAALGWVPCDQAGITPPVPIQREAPGYPQSVREVGIEGSVELALTVLRDGSVGWVRALRAEPRGYFEQAAIEGVRRWRFAPARLDGEPVECRMLTRVRFALADTVDAPDGAASADRPVPAYPAALLRERIEGYAEVEFERAPDGSVGEARVINAMPRGEFERAALAAVRGWKPAPGASRRPSAKRAASSSACRTRRSRSCRRRPSAARRSRWPPASSASPVASRSRSTPTPPARC